VSKQDHKDTAKCGKCGKALRFPKSGLNYAMIAKALGGNIYCPGCEPDRARVMRGMAAAQGARFPAPSQPNRGEGGR
jgi:hypothetical protein